MDCAGHGDVLDGGNGKACRAHTSVVSSEDSSSANASHSSPKPSVASSSSLVKPPSPPAPPLSFDLQLLECHRSLMSVRASVDTKYRELERKYQVATKHLSEARRDLEEKDARVRVLISERDRARDELKREKSGRVDSALMRGVSRENAKMVRKMREMRTENLKLKKENEILRRELGLDDNYDGTPSAASTTSFSSSATRPRAQRGRSAEKTSSNWRILGARVQHSLWEEESTAHSHCSRSRRHCSSGEETAEHNTHNNKKKEERHHQRREVSINRRTRLLSETEAQLAEKQGGGGSSNQHRGRDQHNDEESRSLASMMGSVSTWGFELTASKLWKPVAASLCDEASVAASTSVCSGTKGRIRR